MRVIEPKLPQDGGDRPVSAEARGKLDANAARRSSEGRSHLNVWLTRNEWREATTSHDRIEEQRLTAELAVRLKAGEVAALQEALTLFGPELQAVAYTITRSREDAEDVVEETFIAAWRRIGTLREDAALRRWLLTIATRLATRRRSKSPDKRLAASDAWVPDPATKLVDRHVLNAAMRDLPPHMRAAVALHYVADLTVDDVATVLGRSRNTVKSQLREALRRLRLRLGQDGDT